jgi:hypothetical protein
VFCAHDRFVGQCSGGAATTSGGAATSGGATVRARESTWLIFGESPPADTGASGNNLTSRRRSTRAPRRQRSLAT